MRQDLYSARQTGRCEGMARLPRFFIEGAALHVTVRGNNRQDIFLDDSDRLRFIDGLREAIDDRPLEIHGYVLMTNHVHLLATPGAPDALGRVLQSVGRRYVAYFNKRHRRTGTLWEGRYRASAVQTDRYLMACHRYIDMNPVRAGIVAHPGDHLWSSHHYYARVRADDLVTPHELVVAMGASRSDRAEAYSRLFDEPLETSIIERIRYCTNAGWALGDEAFCRRVEQSGRRAAPVRGGRALFAYRAAPD